MIVNRYTVGEMPNIIIPLGVQGENEARQIQLDFSAWMTEGVVGYPELKVLTPGGTLYWATAQRGNELEIEDGDNIICWTLHTTDTGESGNGLIRLILFGENGERLKSMASRTYLAPEFDEAIPAPAPEEVWQNWVDQMGDNAAATQENAYSASVNATAAEAYAIAIKENRLDLIEGLMNLATTKSVSIPVTGWQSVDGVYEYAVTDPLVSSDTATILHMDDTNAAKCQACIEMETSANTITFRTDTIPTGDISGTLFLQGRFADGGLANLSVKTTVTLAANDWSQNEQTISVEGITENATVIVSPTADSIDTYVEMSIRCIGQGNGTLTFAATLAPGVDVDVNVLAL